MITVLPVQDWLTESAAQISLTNNCVDWVTPLGLPVVQPYHRETTEEIRTPLQNVTSTSSFDHTRRPDMTKQKGGFPPNFVHSLDSSHMMMTSLRCQKEGITYASVHDSFWTHACDVDKMNEVGNVLKFFEKRKPLLLTASDFGSMNFMFCFRVF